MSRSKRHLLRHERKRLEWTFGLFAIGLIVPITFLSLRLPQQAKYSTFENRGIEIERALSRIQAETLNSKEMLFKAFCSHVADPRMLPFLSIKIEGGERHYCTAEPPGFAESYLSYSVPPPYPLQSEGVPLLVRRSIEMSEKSLELQISLHKVPFTKAEFLLVLDGLLIFMALILGFWYSTRLALEHLERIRRYDLFVSSVSHELKTPLAGIRLYAELFLNGRLPTTAERTGGAQNILTEVDRLSDLVENLVHLARSAETRSQEVMMLPQLVENIRKIESAIRHAYPEWRGKVVVEEGENAKAVTIHPQSFSLVMYNLLQNCVKYAGERAELMVFLETTNKNLTVTVRDNGPGIKAAEREEIFLPFKRGTVAKERQAPGTGLGLAVVSELLETVGGDISATNWSGGAEFRLVIPTTA